MPRATARATRAIMNFLVERIAMKKFLVERIAMKNFLVERLCPPTLDSPGWGVCNFV